MTKAVIRLLIERADVAFETGDGFTPSTFRVFGQDVPVPPNYMLVDCSEEEVEGGVRTLVCMPIPEWVNEDDVAQVMGCSVEWVSARAKREGWRSRPAGGEENDG